MRDTGWFKSSYSGAGDDNCVEVRITDRTISIRDTKNRTAGTLHMPASNWGLLASTVMGRIDP